MAENCRRLKSYHFSEPPLYADHLPRYLFAAEYAKGARVLDAATGTGYGAAILVDFGAIDVQAVDASAEAVEVARRRYGNERIRFFQDNCETLEQVRGPVDLICSLETIEHIERPEKFLAAAVRLLSPDGALLCSTPDRATSGAADAQPSNPFHIREWYRHEFAAPLSPFFESIDMRVQVESHAVQSRREAVRNLNAHLSYLWSRPLTRMGRTVARMFGKSRSWPDVRGLVAPSTCDYPIVQSSVAAVMGRAWCHFAICRKPKR